VKYHDFRGVTRSRTLARLVQGEEEIHALAVELLERTEAKKIPVRLLGISLSHLESLSDVAALRHEEN
jgi:DNA polymerase-4